MRTCVCLIAIQYLCFMTERNFIGMVFFVLFDIIKSKGKVNFSHECVVVNTLDFKCLGT